MKKCTKCGQEKAISEFNKFPHGKDGLRAQCKDCDKEYRKINKRGKMPQEGDEYVINSTTMQNHYYLHFGFTERIYTASEWREMSKYNIDSINFSILTQNKNH
jgi:hypothetical protein